MRLWSHRLQTPVLNLSWTSISERRFSFKPPCSETGPRPSAQCDWWDLHPDLCAQTGSGSAQLHPAGHQLRPHSQRPIELLKDGRGVDGCRPVSCVNVWQSAECNALISDSNGSFYTFFICYTVKHKVPSLACLHRPGLSPCATHGRPDWVPAPEKDG